MALNRRALGLLGAGALTALAAALLTAPDPEATPSAAAPAPTRGQVTAPMRATTPPVTLEPAADAEAPARSLRGRVEDARSGAPIAGARVAVRALGGGPVRFAETDAAGAFALGDLPAVTLEVVPVAEGWPVPAPRAVAPDEQDLRLRLERLLLSGTVRGVVPRPELRVEALADGDGQTVAVTVAAAAFELALPHPGRWAVRALQRGAASPWQTVELDADLVLELELAAEVAVTGTIRDPQGTPRLARVELRDAVGRAQHTASDASGAFRVAGVPGETYTLIARVPGLAPAVREVVAPASLDVWLAPLVTLPVTPFVGRDGLPVRGTLTLDPGPRDPHAHPDPQLPFEVGFDRDGRPELAGLPPGRWELAFVEPAADELRAWVLELDTDAPQPLAFDGQGPRSRVEGRVRARFVEGELIQVELRPAPPRDAPSEPSESPPPAFQFVAARAAQADGRFAFEAVPPGEYVLHADWGSGTAQGEPFTVVAGQAAWVEVGE